MFIKLVIFDIRDGQTFVCSNKLFILILTKVLEI